MKCKDRGVLFYEIVNFPIRKRNFRVWGPIGGFWEPSREKKRRFQMFLQSPLLGEKKVRALFFSRKKRTFGEDGERSNLSTG